MLHALHAVQMHMLCVYDKIMSLLSMPWACPAMHVPDLEIKMALTQHSCKQDKLKEASDRAADRAAAPASPEQGKLATRLRAELEVHKEAMATAKEEVASLASSLEKANSWIEVSTVLLILTPISLGSLVYYQASRLNNAERCSLFFFVFFSRGRHP